MSETIIMPQPMSPHLIDRTHFKYNFINWFCNSSDECFNFSQSKATKSVKFKLRISCYIMCLSLSESLFDKFTENIPYLWHTVRMCYCWKTIHYWVWCGQCQGWAGYTGQCATTHWYEWESPQSRWWPRGDRDSLTSPHECSHQWLHFYWCLFSVNNTNYWTAVSLCRP